jgi:hypothetical protein
MNSLDTIVVFTGESPEEIVQKGGSEGWTLNHDKAAKCKFLVCTQNREAGHPFRPTQQHGEAFLVGKIRQVRLQKRGKRTNRFMIHLASYARANTPGVWSKTGASRNPIRYTSLKELGIDLGKLKFKPIPKIKSEEEGHKKSTPTGGQKMGQQMEGITGWFSLGEKFDDVECVGTLNEDGSIDLEFEYPGDGKWKVHLSPDERWKSLTGYAICPRTRATITWAFLNNYGSRRWVLCGEWVQEGKTDNWHTKLLETAPVTEAQLDESAPA